jgi:hypothetical protein
MEPLLVREDELDLEVEVLQELNGAGAFEYFGFIMTRHKNAES